MSKSTNGNETSEITAACGSDKYFRTDKRTFCSSASLNSQLLHKITVSFQFRSPIYHVSSLNDAKIAYHIVYI